MGFQIYEYREIIKHKKIPILTSVITTYQKFTPKVGKEEAESKGELEFKRSLYIALEIIVGLVFYLVAIWFNWPKSDEQSDNWQAPTLLYALLIIWFMTLLIGLIAYYFDKSFDEQKDFNSSRYNFRQPVTLFLILFIASGYGAFQVDHYFQLKDSEVMIGNYEQDFKTAIGNRLCREDFQKNQSCSQEQAIVIVAASGGGIQASGWTAQVLAGLQDDKRLGTDFTKRISLISSASGGSVGTMFYLDEFENDVLNNSQKMIANATDDWLDSVGWGLAYPDLVRVIGFPFLAPKSLDRGYALEKDWQRTLKKPTLTLDDWYKKAKNGDIPIPVFNSTLVENGRRFLISPMKFLPGEMADYLNGSEESKQAKALDFRTLYCGKPEEKKPCNLDVTTAARLSASFPYVSPMARNNEDNKIVKGSETILQNYHMTDGGYFDNSGSFTAIEWLDQFLEKNAKDLNIKKVVLLQINAFPEAPLKLQEEGSKGFSTVILGPFNALNGVRDSTQVARNIQAIKLLKDSWNNDGKSITIQEFAISFPQKDVAGKNYNQPLSWRLTQKQKENLEEAWVKDETIRNTVHCLESFWNNDQIDFKVCKNLS